MVLLLRLLLFVTGGGGGVASRLALLFAPFRKGAATVAYKFVDTGAEVNSDNALKITSQLAATTKSSVGTWISSTARRRFRLSALS
jgi:hypothetical protein